MAYWITQTNFQPFHDDNFYYGKKNIQSIISGGIDTSGIDIYREGVNLRTTKDIFNAKQIKISFMDGTEDLPMKMNGNLTHQSPFTTFGQAVDFVQFTNNFAFKDSQTSIDGTFLTSNNVKCSKMVQYLVYNGAIVNGELDSEDFYPIYLNGGPQFVEEAIIEPFVIPSRLPTNESEQELSKGIFAFLEEGNVGDERRFGSSQNEQMINRDFPTSVRPYLEYGATTLIITNSLGKVIDTIYTKPSAIPDQSVIYKISPWVDEAKNKYFPRFTDTLDILSCSVAKDNTTVQYFTINYGNDNSGIQTRDQKSSTAGYSVYGPNAGYYGTDSIAFVNRLRGS